MAAQSSHLDVGKQGRVVGCNGSLAAEAGGRAFFHQVLQLLYGCLQLLHLGGSQAHHHLRLLSHTRS